MHTICMVHVRVCMVHVRVYVFLPMFERFRVCVSACVCLPFVSVCACVRMSVRVCVRVC